MMERKVKFFGTPSYLKSQRNWPLVRSLGLVSSTTVDLASRFGSRNTPTTTRALYMGHLEAEVLMTGTTPMKHQWFV